MAAPRSACHPPSENSPSDRPVPLKSNVTTTAPVSAARRTASSGNPELGEPALWPAPGNPWESTMPLRPAPEAAEKLGRARNPLSSGPPSPLKTTSSPVARPLPQPPALLAAFLSDRARLSSVNGRSRRRQKTGGRAEARPPVQIAGKARVNRLVCQAGPAPGRCHPGVWLGFDQAVQRAVSGQPPPRSQVDYYYSAGPPPFFGGPILPRLFRRGGIFRSVPRGRCSRRCLGAPGPGRGPWAWPGSAAQRWPGGAGPASREQAAELISPTAVVLIAGME